MMHSKTGVAIFASGSGTNAVKLIDYFSHHKDISIRLLVCNNPLAGVIEKATSRSVEVLMIEKERFFRGDGYVDTLKEKGIDWIVLAGFLWKIPKTLIGAFPDKIVNIHPALLPKYGGKGMYGMHVHEAVIAAGEVKSGITIHLVDEIYDHGRIIFQAECPVTPTDHPDDLAKKVQELEHKHFAEEVVKIIVRPA
jgi:phosphoribosylglycinamide formyltransferase-1